MPEYIIYAKIELERIYAENEKEAMDKGRILKADFLAEFGRYPDIDEIVIEELSGE